MTMQCPPPHELLLDALQLREHRQSEHVARHVNRCGACQSAINGLREITSVLQSAPGASLDTAGCLDEMAIARIVDADFSISENSEQIFHIASCSRCRDHMASLARLLRTAPVASAIQQTSMLTPVPSTHRWRIAGTGALTAIAAAAVLMVALPKERAAVTRPVNTTEKAPVHREPAMTTTVAPTLISPIALAAADTFRWRSVPRADRYRLIVFDRDGNVVWEMEGADTAVAVPKSISDGAGSTYLWKIEARTGWDRWVASELVQFSTPNNGRTP